jgi:hypothetical protein
MTYTVFFQSRFRGSKNLLAVVNVPGAPACPMVLRAADKSLPYFF